MLEGAWDQAALVTWSIYFEGNLIKGAETWPTLLKMYWNKTFRETWTKLNYMSCTTTAAKEQDNAERENC